MMTGTKAHRGRIISRQDKATPYPLPCWNVSDTEVHHPKKKEAFEKKDWEDVTCSVCLEYPHNAVLLLCSSHDNGCRPYMCGTSYRHSNCLDQFEKAYAKIMSDEDNLRSAGTEKSELMELAACPLCRGQVKGWTVVESAREYFNAKKRSCMQDNCTFTGTYKQLRKHVKREHPCARPREVDPLLEQKWRRLENERERDDVISTVTSSIPGATVLGDYVIERGNHHRFDSWDEDEDFFIWPSNGSAGNRSLNTRRRWFGRGGYQDGGGGGGIGIPPPMSTASSDEVVAPGASASEGVVVGRRQRRVLLQIQRLERRRMHRS